MQNSRIKPRRPLGWNAVLRKGHVHERSRTAQRQSSKRSLDDEIERYFQDRADEIGVHEDADFAFGSFMRACGCGSSGRVRTR